MLVRNYPAALALSSGNQVQVKSGRILSTNANATVSAWVKFRGAGGTNGNSIYCERAATGNDIWKMEIGNSSASFKLRFVQRNTAGTLNQLSANKSFQGDGAWHHVAVTKSGTAVTFYVDGLIDSAATLSGNDTLTTTGTICLIGSDAADASSFINALISDVRLYASALTPAQVLTLYTTGIDPTTSVGTWPLTEGAGTSATDSSGNGNTGTITGATYSADTPLKSRKLVGGNLIYNGDFEYAPPFTAATTASGTWINGTAGGSTGENLFGWGIQPVSGSGAASFDSTNSHSGTYSLKLSTTAVASYIEVHPIRLNLSSQRQAYTISVLPSTSYTASYWMKTTANSGTATNGARIDFLEYDASTNLLATNGTTNVITTTGWTQYNVTFTTGATTRFLDVSPHIYGHQGTGTLIMDAWFDDITLVQA